MVDLRWNAEVHGLVSSDCCLSHLEAQGKQNSLRLRGRIAEVELACFYLIKYPLCTCNERLLTDTSDVE